ncbi:UPF0659 protein [Vanrija pseudolonga]|uniref:UPF0659 protein n=1 Tax=Vanrija pseudolonga TaxID=143232 RepID=A0AAF0YFC7_9TREE|nr:UPF0659 protein [Vanrija pseudolonga]
MPKLLIFGGGGVIARKLATLAVPKYTVVSVIRNDGHAAVLTALGATPLILSLEHASVAEIADVLTAEKPDVVVFSAGASGGADRTRAVDYEGAVKVYDALEASGVRRFLLVSAWDARDRSKPAPAYYTEEGLIASDRAWNFLPDYYPAKRDAEIALHKYKNIDYTVLRPVLFTDAPVTGATLGQAQGGKVSKDLVAEALFALVQRPDTAGLTLDLADGTESLASEVDRVVEQRIDNNSSTIPMPKLLIIGGGGAIARRLAKLATPTHTVVSVIRNDGHAADLAALGAKPLILSIEDASSSDIAHVFTAEKPDVVVFAAGAANAARTRAVDYEGAVKVYDALEESGIRRFLLVSAWDARNRDKPPPKHYTAQSLASSDRVWTALKDYYIAKRDAEVELHKRKNIDYTVLRPVRLTDEPAGGATLGLSTGGAVSRELVAQVLLALAGRPDTAGLTLDLADGPDSVEWAVARAAEEKIDVWED